MAGKIKLNLGCGVAARAGWINVDKYLTEKGLKGKKGFYKNAIWEKGAKFIQADILKLPFKDNYADVVELHQVLEHMKFADVIPALHEIYRVMKKGATCILDVPSFDGLAVDWLQMSIRKGFDPQFYRDVMETIVGNQAGEGDGEVHKSIFNYNFLNFCITGAGFTDGTILIYSKGAPVPAIGELSPANPNSVMRHDIIVATLKK